MIYSPSPFRGSSHTLAGTWRIIEVHAATILAIEEEISLVKNMTTQSLQEACKFQPLYSITYCKKLYLRQLIVLRGRLNFDARVYSDLDTYAGDVKLLVSFAVSLLSAGIAGSILVEYKVQPHLKPDHLIARGKRALKRSRS